MYAAVEKFAYFSAHVLGLDNGTGASAGTWHGQASRRRPARPPVCTENLSELMTDGIA